MKLVGIGEKIDDLMEFRQKAYAEILFEGSEAKEPEEAPIFRDVG